jgi:hypothetical protein
LAVFTVGVLATSPSAREYAANAIVNTAKKVGKKAIGSTIAKTAAAGAAVGAGAYAAKKALDAKKKKSKTKTGGVQNEGLTQVDEIAPLIGVIGTGLVGGAAAAAGAQGYDHLSKKYKERKAKKAAQASKTKVGGVQNEGLKEHKRKKTSKTKTGGVQNEDLKQVEFEGEIIYEPLDSTNMPVHAPEVVEYTSHAYDYNRSSWMDALSEVNRYKGRSGHRVTQVDKSGDEHVVMQLRKAVSMRDAHTGVKFKDGETHKISAKTAQKHLDHYNTLKPEDKIKWQNSASHSHAGLSSASGEKKKGQVKTSSSSGRDEPTRQLINPMDKD